MDPPADERDELGVSVRMGTCGSSKVPAARVGLVARGGSRVEQSELRGGDQGHRRDPPRLHEQAGSLTLQPNHRQPTCHHSSTRDLPAPTTTDKTSLLGDIYLLPHGEGPWRESSRCPSLIGLRPHPTGTEPWPLFGDPIFSTWPRGLAHAEQEGLP